VRLIGSLSSDLFRISFVCIAGAVEIFLVYIFPQGKIFDSIYDNFRLFGSILLVLLGLIVLAGVKVTYIDIRVPPKRNM